MTEPRDGSRSPPTPTVDPAGVETYSMRMADVFWDLDLIGCLEVGLLRNPLRPASPGAVDACTWRMTLDIGRGQELGLGSVFYGLVVDDSPTIRQWQANQFTIMGQQLRLEWQQRRPVGTGATQDE